MANDFPLFLQPIVYPCKCTIIRTSGFSCLFRTFKQKIGIFFWGIFAHTAPCHIFTMSLPPPVAALRRSEGALMSHLLGSIFDSVNNCVNFASASLPIETLTKRSRYSRCVSVTICVFFELSDWCYSRYPHNGLAVLPPPQQKYYYMTFFLGGESSQTILRTAWIKSVRYIFSWLS